MQHHRVLCRILGVVLPPRFTPLLVPHPVSTHVDKAWQLGKPLNTQSLQHIWRYLISLWGFSTAELFDDLSDFTQGKKQCLHSSFSSVSIKKDKGFKRSPKCSIHHPMAFSVEVNRVPSLMYTAVHSLDVSPFPLPEVPDSLPESLHQRRLSQ